MAKVPRTTISQHSKTSSPNLLKELEKTDIRAGELIVGDITYLPLIGGRFCFFSNVSGRADKAHHRLVSITDDAPDLSPMR